MPINPRLNPSRAAECAAKQWEKVVPSVPEGVNSQLHCLYVTVKHTSCPGASGGEWNEDGLSFWAMKNYKLIMERHRQSLGIWSAVKISKPTHCSLAHTPLPPYTVLILYEADEMSPQRLLLCSHLDMLYSELLCSHNNGITPGIHLFWIHLPLWSKGFFKKALIEHVHWGDARIGGDLKQSEPVSVYTGPMPNDWTDMTRLGAWEVKKRAYLTQRSNQTTAKVESGLDRGRTANEPENVPQHYMNSTVVKETQKHCHKTLESA